MAIVINQDGTVSTVDVYYNRDGSIKGIKRDSSLDNDYIPKSGSSYIRPPKKKKAKKKTSRSTTVIKPKKENSSNVIAVPNPSTNHSTSTISKKKVERKTKPSKPITPKPAEDSSLEPYFTSVAEIDQYIADKKDKGQTIELNEYLKIRKSLPGVLCSYFTSKCKAYFVYCKEIARKILKAAKVKKKKKNKKKRKRINDNVTFNSRKIQTIESDIVDERSSFGASRKPKYGYARDRYGRVQERDSFNEERRNEFHHAQSHQKNYDYSSYDANDDHDGAYSDWK